MLSAIKRWLLSIPAIKGFYANQVKRYRTKIVIDTLALAHAQELRNTPIMNWPLVKQQQALQIQAVREGKLDIVDRRSYEWPYLPLSIGRSPQPVIKFSPANIRRFAKTPVARRAINLIKGAILSLAWDVIPIDGGEEDANEDLQQRINSVKYSIRHPNNTDSWQTFLEVGIDDFCTLGAMVVESQLTPDPNRPFKLWNVDCATIRIFPSWKESTPDKPRYAQMMGVLTDNGAIPFLDSELLYLRDNPTVDSPFGLGKMEVAFESVAALLGVQQMASRAGADATARTALWWEAGQVHQNVEVVRRHLQNDIEGQARVALISGMPKPEAIDLSPATSDDFYIPWQEMLIRMVGNSFDLSGMALGIERDVNRSTGEVLDDKDFRSAVVPIAVKIAEAITRFFLHRLLGYTDLAFKFVNLEDPDIATKLTQLTQLWNMNAITPNGVLKSLGRPPLISPYADLTQFEQLLVNTEAAGKIQDNLANNNMQRQQQMMEQFSDQPGEDSIAPTPTAPTSKTAPSNNSLILPKSSVPKSSMKGSRLNARQVAAMSLPQLQAAIKKGVISADANELTEQMEQQEPGILMQLAPEVVQYLDQLKQEQNKEERNKKVKPSAATAKNLKKRFRQNKKKQVKLDMNKRRNHPEQ